MANIGYIPLSRRFFEHELWLEPRVFSRAEAFADLLRRVRFEANTSTILVGAQSIDLHRGEVAVSLRYLASQWQWSKNKVDKFLKYLEKQGMIEKRTAIGTSQTIVRLCNFDKYNPICEKSGHVKGQQRDSRGTILNKDNKENNIIPPIIPQRGKGDNTIPDFPRVNPLPEKEKVARKRKVLDLSSVEPSFQPIVADWLAYKSERGQTYRQKGFDAFYSHLLQISFHSPGIARQIIEQSMANNWAGLFPLKIVNNEPSAKNIPPSPDELAQAVAAGISRAHTRQEWE